MATRNIKMADGTTRTITFDRMGTDRPMRAHVTADTCNPWYNEDTGMEYELYPTTGNGDAPEVVYVAACHEDVGVVVWYRFANADDAYTETQAR